jgi:hypothetical protein
MARNFALCFLLRFGLALAFTVTGHFGAGGDALVYHVLGLHASGVVFGAPVAPLPDLILQWWDDAEPLTAKYSTVVDEISGSTGAFPYSDTIAIVALHGMVYWFNPHPLMFVLVTSLISSLATSMLIREFSLQGWASGALIANPLSVYFAATHLKESLCEALVIALAVSCWKRRAPLASLVAATALVMFRPAFLPVVLLMVVAPHLTRFDVRLVAAGALVTAMLFPGIQWETTGGTGGAIFSVVNLNEATKAILGTAVGFGAPYFFLVDGFAPFSVAMFLGGFVYWAFLPRGMAAFASGETNCFIWVPILLSALFAYMVVGDLSTKTRFFSPFLPLLIAGVASLSVRRESYVRSADLSRTA